MSEVKPKYTRDGVPMIEVSFPLFKNDKKEHENLEKQATELYEKFLSGDENVPGMLMPFLKGWLAEHIMETDREMGHFLAQHPG